MTSSRRSGGRSEIFVPYLNAGSDFEIVAVSFDPRDTPKSASAKKAAYLERYKRPGAAEGWHFLTGDQQSIDALTKLQEQTAQLHLQFLQGQEAAQRSVQALIEQQQALSAHASGVGELSTKSTRVDSVDKFPPRITQQ